MVVPESSITSLRRGWLMMISEENTVQSRHLDGFMSSLGCKTKERIGHLYR